MSDKAISSTPSTTKTNRTGTTMLGVFYNYSSIIIGIILCFVFIVMAITDYNMTAYSYTIYLVLALLPLLIIYILWDPPFLTNVKGDMLSKKWKIIWSIVIIAIVVSLVLLITVLYRYLSPADITAMGYVRIILYMIFISLFFYYLYNVLYESSFNYTGILGFITRILLIIPNLFIDIFKWIYPKVSLENIILFIIVVFLCTVIIIYVYWGKIMDYLIGDNSDSNGNGMQKGVVLLRGPVAINTKNAVSVPMPPTLPNYTFSFWVYINNSPTSNYEIPVFNYGNNCPLITINNNITNNMTFYGTPIDTTPFSVLSQKWNYIVVQYTGTTADLYLNCDLIHTVVFNDNNLPTYSFGDNAIIGDGTIASRGIGAISIVKYFTYSLTQQQMQGHYKYHLLQNVPTVF